MKHSTILLATLFVLTTASARALAWAPAPVERPAPATPAAVDTAPTVTLRTSASIAASAGFEAGFGISLIANAPLVAGISVMPFSLLARPSGAAGLAIGAVFLMGGVACVGASVAGLVGGILFYRSGHRRRPTGGLALAAYDAGAQKGAAVGLALHGAVYTALGAALTVVNSGQQEEDGFGDSRAFQIGGYLALGVGIAQLAVGAVLGLIGWRGGASVLRRVAIAPAINRGVSSLVVAGVF